MSFNNQGSRGLRMSLPELNTIPSIAFLKNTVPLSRQSSNQGSTTGSIVEDNLSDLEGLSSQDSQGSQGSQEFRSVENSLNTLSAVEPQPQQHQVQVQPQHQAETYVAMPAQSQVAEPAAISPRPQVWQEQTFNVWPPRIFSFGYARDCIESVRMSVAFVILHSCRTIPRCQ